MDKQLGQQLKDWRLSLLNPLYPSLLRNNCRPSETYQVYTRAASSYRGRGIMEPLYSAICHYQCQACDYKEDVQSDPFVRIGRYGGYDIWEPFCPHEPRSHYRWHECSPTQFGCLLLISITRGPAWEIENGKLLLLTSPSPAEASGETP